MSSSSSLGFQPSSRPFRPSSHSHADVASVITQPTLRLACQDSPANWRHRGWTEAQHDDHAKRAVYRALVELLAKARSAEIVRKSTSKSPPEKLSVNHSNFESYCETFFLKHSLVPRHGISHEELCPISTSLIQDGLSFLDKNKTILKVTEGYAALQYNLQPVIESFVLFDRLAFVEDCVGKTEQGSLVKLFDESLSPRCWAVVSVPRKEELS